jgi:ubiquinone/menaquinone biosynthesis C-methylase UbiE
MVSIRQTSLKYHGAKARTYDTIRTKQARWDFENKTVWKWLEEMKPIARQVLDCPVGTGRFLKKYHELSIHVHGYDISEEMLRLAKRKVPKGNKLTYLSQHSATSLPTKDRFFDGAVCVRFLDLIDEEAMRKVMEELARVPKRFIILTIRLGDKYVPKSNTAEHDARKFRALVKRLGFSVSDSAQFREGSWHVMLLSRT